MYNAFMLNKWQEKDGTFKDGEKPWNFKGKYIRNDGYVFVYQPNHPFAMGRSKYVMEHRLVMENKIGRYLKPEEQVHHINQIKNDNRSENLQLYANNSEHKRLHVKKIINNEKMCSFCKLIKDIKNFPYRKNNPKSLIPRRFYSSWCYDCCRLKSRQSIRNIKNRT